MHVLGARGRQVLADVVRPDRQLAVAAVGEHRQLHARGATVVEQRLDRGADGASGEEDVVDDHDRFAREVEVDVRGVHHRGLGPAGDIVAVEADVEIPERNLRVEQLFELHLQPPRQKRAAPMDADQRRSRRQGIALDDLMRDAHQRPPHVLRLEDDLLVAVHRFLPGLSGPG